MTSDTRPRETDQLLDDLRRGEESARKTAILKLTKDRDVRGLAMLRKVEASDESAEIRFVAKKALVYLAKGAAEAEDVAAFDADEPRERIEALERAAILDDRESLPAVLARVQTEDDPQVKRTLVTALGILGNKEHAGILDRFLEEGDAEIRVRALESLEHLDDVSNYPIYVRYSNDADPRVRRNAVRALGRLGRKKMIRLCLALTRSNRSDLAHNALRILVGIKTDEAIPCFEKHLTSSDGSLRELARSGLEKLAGSGDAAAAALLEKATGISPSRELHALDELPPGPEGLDSLEASARLDAVLRVEESSDADALPALVRHLEHEKEPRVRATIVRAVGKLGDRSHIGVLELALRDGHDRVRANAVEAYAALTTAEDRRPLSFLLRDPNNRVRTNAILALWGLGLKDVREALIALSRGDTARDRLSAIWAINSIGEQAGNLLGPLTRDKNEDVRVKAEECQRMLGLASSKEFQAIVDPAIEAEAGPGPGRGRRTQAGAPTSSMMENFQKDISTASIRLSTELKTRMARQHCERILEDIGEEYFRVSGRRVPEDEALTRELFTALTDETRGRRAVAGKLQNLGRRVRDEALGQGERIETLLARLVRAEEDLRRLEGELKLIGQRSLMRQMKILGVVSLVLLLSVGLMVYVLLPQE